MLIETGATNRRRYEFIMYRQCQTNCISFIGEVTGCSSKDNWVGILHIDLSEAADITSSDCSQEQSKETEPG